MSIKVSFIVMKKTAEHILIIIRRGINCSDPEYWKCSHKNDGSDECISAYFVCDGKKDCEVNRKQYMTNICTVSDL